MGAAAEEKDAVFDSDEGEEMIPLDANDRRWILVITVVLVIVFFGIIGVFAGFEWLFTAKAVVALAGLALAEGFRGVFAA